MLLSQAEVEETRIAKSSNSFDVVAQKYSNIYLKRNTSDQFLEFVFYFRSFMHNRNISHKW